jgi:hypothetical protein
MLTEALDEFQVFPEAPIGGESKAPLIMYLLALGSERTRPISWPAFIYPH